MTTISSSAVACLALALTVIIIMSTTAATLITATESSSSYDALCQQIVQLGKRAADEANSGNFDTALKTVDEARAVFGKAAAQEPKNPQAYADIGILLLNANKFNESIDALEKAVELLGPEQLPIRGQPPSPVEQARNHFRQSIRRAKYGYCSKMRDEVYDEGRGDVAAAYEWALKQLSFSAVPYRTHHELGTLAVALCEYDIEMCEKADEHFHIASMVAHQRYCLSRSEQTDSKLGGTSKDRFACIHSNLSIGSWGNHKKKVTTTTISGSIYLHEIDGHRLMLNGRDGVVTFPADPADCAVLSTASDHYLDLGANLLPTPDMLNQVNNNNPKSGALAANSRGMPGRIIMQATKRISRGMTVISAVQFASTSFYHWLVEALPRLIVASIHWEKWREAVILVPKLQGTRDKFITESLSLLFRDRVSVAEYQPYTEAAQLAFVTWEQPDCPHKAGKPCAALTNNFALILARNEIVRSIRRTGYDNIRFTKPVVIFAMRGSGVTMRNFDEAAFLDKLERTLLKKKINADVIAHDSGKMSLGQALATYRRATVVLGAHGGALSNIIACAPGTSVIEIGFTTASARHYDHMSRALSLDYRLVEVQPDPLKRALTAPTISFDEEHVINMVIQAIPVADQQRALYAAEFDRDTDPKHDPRDELQEQWRIDKESEMYFNSKDPVPPRDDNVWEEHGGNANAGKQQELPSGDL